MQSGGCSSSSPPPFTFFRHDTPEVRTWIRAGTAPDDAALAGDLIAAGTHPERLYKAAPLTPGWT